MNFFDIFDFNGDGKVDPAEELLGLDMLCFFDEAEDDGDDEPGDGD